MIDVKAKAGDEKIATVYVAETAEGRMIEFVESIQPPLPIEKKWVLIISTLHGCAGFVMPGEHSRERSPHRICSRRSII